MPQSDYWPKILYHFFFSPRPELLRVVKRLELPKSVRIWYISNLLLKTSASLTPDRLMQLTIRLGLLPISWLFKEPLFSFEMCFWLAVHLVISCPLFAECSGLLKSSHILSLPTRLFDLFFLFVFCFVRNRQKVTNSISKGPRYSVLFGSAIDLSSI